MNLMTSLGRAFNSILSVALGDGYQTRGFLEGGGGVQRARARLDAHRKAQAERLKDARWPLMTRQQARAESRRWMKKNIPTAVQRAFFAVNFDWPSYSRRTFVNLNK